MSDPGYVHGYSLREAARLADQADTLAELLHHDSHYPAGARVLECGCGTGAQTVHLAASSPEAEIVAVDIVPESLEQAQRRVEAAGHGNVSFQVADVFDLPFAEASFDHVFVCFLLEHLAGPERALLRLRRVLREGGSITVIEGDHGSWYCHPSTPEARRTVECLIEIQARHGGDALIGRRVYPLLCETGFHTVHVSPRLVYVDDSRPDLIEGFSKNTFIAMVEGVREQALALGLMDEPSWDRGIADMHKATEPGGTFAYTFFKGTALK
ncbi:MAG: methyltransferase domain-containing protein [Gaiellaceae bacterium]|jgi:ubiquinone/menaquinone biosynthesis C-methylase UbiE